MQIRAIGISATEGVRGRAETIATTVSNAQEKRTETPAVDSIRTTYYGEDGKPFRSEIRARRDNE